MPTPSGRFKNWTNVIFTPLGGSPIAFRGVTDVQIAMRAQVIAGAGDADMGPTSKHVVGIDPQVTIEFDHLATLMGLAPGMHGSFTATHNDADNEEGTGAMVYTVANCIVGDLPRGGRFRQYGTSRVTIETYSPDGRTNPVSITIAA